MPRPKDAVPPYKPGDRVVLTEEGIRESGGMLGRSPLPYDVTRCYWSNEYSEWYVTLRHSAQWPARFFEKKEEGNA